MSPQPPESGLPGVPSPPSASQPNQSPPTTTPAASPRVLENDPQRTGFDPATNKWVNYFHALTGSMTREGAFHFQQAQAKANEARDCARCEKWRDWALTYSPTVVFMRQKIAALNGRLDDSNIVCRRCPKMMTEDGWVHGQSGGWDPNGGVLLCANDLRNKTELEDTLAHEMVHAWDHLRWKVDWVGEKSLKHAACTEIRASMLSGECRWAREALKRGNMTVTQQFQECVRRRATASVMARPSCKDDVQAVKVVNQVWDSCFSDTRPFDEVYR
ncbi:peptidase M76 family-domain-containing protein [Xylariomycetidae sp. FL0641]|nr:peptidase M76 family-domain-containing protein [Xylariomycetidae sp. FL0641]